MQYRKKEKTKKNKKKGLILTFVFHGLAVALALYPLMNLDQEQKEQIEAIVVEFDFGAKAEGAKKVKKKEVEKKREVKKMASITKPAPKMVTTDQPSELKVPDVKRPVEKVERIPDPVPSDVPAKTEKQTKMEIPNIYIPEDKPVESDKGSAEGEAEGAEVDATESGDGQGEEGEGKFDKGDSGDKGNGYIEGDGTLSRKVIKRASVHAMVKKEGTIIMKICVTRSGAVDYVEFDRNGSTITDRDIVDAAIDAMTKYRFEKDYTAPARECGRFRYNIEYGF
jgi:outer membrane biosynthesis protein TonB